MPVINFWKTKTYRDLKDSYLESLSGRNILFPEFLKDFIEKRKITDLFVEKKDSDFVRFF